MVYAFDMVQCNFHEDRTDTCILDSCLVISHNSRKCDIQKSSRCKHSKIAASSDLILATSNKAARRVAWW